MRYLGWGIGQLNPSDFPHEAEDLLASEADRQVLDITNTSSIVGADAEGDRQCANGDVLIPTVEDLEAEDEGKDSSGDDDPLQFTF